MSISHAATGGNVHIIDMALVSSQSAQNQDQDHVAHCRWRVARGERGRCHAAFAFNNASVRYIHRTASRTRPYMKTACCGH
ncbi:hypothetical protein [Caballeronia sp. KNU42]